MGIGCKSAIVVLTAGLSSLVASTAMAQSVLTNPAANRLPVPGDSRGVLPQYDDAYFSSGGTFFDNRTVLGQTKFLIGPFTENQIGRDGQNLHDTYLKTLAQQTGAGPVVRTIDLPSPFNQSLRSVLSAGTARTYPPVERFPINYPPAVTPAPAPPAPVPALW
jgi:hypothetical protein